MYKYIYNNVTQCNTTASIYCLLQYTEFNKGIQKSHKNLHNLAFQFGILL